MPNATMWAGALSLFLRHTETGCRHAARQAAEVLDRLAADPDLDSETRNLCERASTKLHEGIVF